MCSSRQHGSALSRNFWWVCFIHHMLLGFKDFRNWPMVSASLATKEYFSFDSVGAYFKFILMNEWMKKSLFSFWKKSQRKRKSWEQVSLEMGGKKNNKKSKGGIEKRKKIGDCGLEQFFAFHFFPWRTSRWPLLVFSAVYVPLCPWKGVCWFLLQQSPHWPTLSLCSLAGCSRLFICTDAVLRCQVLKPWEKQGRIQSK